MEEENQRIGVIFCLSFGKRSSGLSLSNKFLLDKVKEFRKRYPLPVIIQADCVDDSLQNSSDIRVIREHRVAGMYLDTVEVIRQFIDLYEKNNYEKVFVFAHPDHLKRISGLLSHYNLIFEIVSTKGCPYDIKSSQIWTRNKFLFTAREFVVIIYYKLKKFYKPCG